MMTELDVSNNFIQESKYQNSLESKAMIAIFYDQNLVFLSSILYALCIETKRILVNQNKGKITLIIFTWNSVSLAMS